VTNPLSSSIGGGQLPVDGDIQINAVTYRTGGQARFGDHSIDGKRRIKIETVPVQPGETHVEFERRLINLARGWGQSKWDGPGGVDYGDTAVLHRDQAFLPGSTVTTRTNATVPIGPVSFCEYWDETTANRRLLVVTPRHVYEIDSAGTQTANDLGAGFTLANGMSKGVLYRTGAMAAPKVFIARYSNTSSDYMVRRTAANTYAVGTANTKFAAALGKGKDSAGADVLWRVNENGKLNQALADNDPNLDASWSAAIYPSSLFPLGDTSSRVMDLVQQNKAMVAAKTDGFYTFDTVLNTLPIIPLWQTPDPRNGTWIKDANGMAVAPTVAGLLWMDGLEWGPCGPVSSNPDARQYRGREVAVSGMVGDYLYCAVYFGTTSYIFMGKQRAQGDTGKGPFAWHGPVAKIAKKATDLWISTVFGRKLWIGFTDDGGTVGGYASIELEADFSPTPDLATGYIYLPEGCLDMAGPAVIKDVRKVEFIAPADKPFAAGNAWSIELNMDAAGYVAIDGGAVTSGVTADRYFSTAMRGKRPLVRLAYSGNSGGAELEGVVIHGTQAPETTEEYTIPLILKNGQRTPQGVAQVRTGLGDYAVIRALVDSGATAIVIIGGVSFNARLTEISSFVQRVGTTGPPEYEVEVIARRIKVA